MIRRRDGSLFREWNFFPDYTVAGISWMGDKEEILIATYDNIQDPDEKFEHNLDPHF